ncbi:MAG: TIGR02147 family protein [Pseudobdellovibrionaceae bacterium]
MGIYKYSDYRQYVNSRINNLPKNGRGEYRRISEALNVHTSTVSHIFKGKKGLTMEQGAALATYLGLSEAESDYLLTLIEIEKAGTADLKRKLEARLEKQKQLAAQLSNRIPRDTILSEEHKALFYSNWYYSAIRLATDIEDLRTDRAIADYLNLNVDLVRKVLMFLSSVGLCVDSNGQFRMGPQRTVLESGSPLISRHLTNWRLKAIEKSSKTLTATEFQFTSSMSLSKEVADEIREHIAKEVQKIIEKGNNSKSEELFFLNVDWLKMH